MARAGGAQGIPLGRGRRNPAVAGSKATASALARLCGLRPLACGSLQVEGRIAYVPEDRHRHGLLLAAPAWENTLLGRQDESQFGRPWALDLAAARALAAAIVKDYDVRPPQMEQPAGAFSGGNQQKLIVGREIAKSPSLLVAANPTRGVDLGAALPRRS